MKGIERLLETAKAVVKATERKETELVALLVPNLKEEVQDFEKEHFPDGLVAESGCTVSRQKVYKALKARSLELQGRS